MDFERWRMDAERNDLEAVVSIARRGDEHQAAGITTDLFQQIGIARHRWRVAIARLSLRAGQPRDGVTMTVPLIALNQIDAEQCEWLVPGMLKGKGAPVA